MSTAPKDVIPPTTPVRIAEMEPWVARSILRGCDRADQALLDVDAEIEKGRIFAMAKTITYPGRPGVPIGENARVRQSHWRKIVGQKLRDDFWANGIVELADPIPTQLVVLRGIRLNGADVRRFASRYNHGGGDRVDVDLIGHVPTIRDAHELAETLHRPDKEAHWEAFWLTVVKFAAEGKLSGGYFGSQNKLSWAIIDAMGRHKLSKNTVDPKVSLIWAQIIDRMAPSGAPAV